MGVFQDFYNTYIVVISFMAQGLMFGFVVGLILGFITIPFSFLFKK